MSSIEELEKCLEKAKDEKDESMILFFETKIGAIKAANVQDQTELNVDSVRKNRHEPPKSSINSSAEQHLHRRQYGIEPFKPQLRNPIRASGIMDGKKHNLKPCVTAVCVGRGGRFIPIK